MTDPSQSPRPAAATALPPGARVRFFAVTNCWYHGEPGRVVEVDSGIPGQYRIELECRPVRPVYSGLGGAYGLVPWDDRRPCWCGFPCADAPRPARAARASAGEEATHVPA